MTEIIEKQIPGYPDYTVNTIGEVFSHKYGGRRKLKQSLGGGKIETNKRPVVMLAKDNKGTSFKVQFLVLNTFNPKPSPDLVCRHLNGDRLDNRLCNLQWGTRSDNNIDTSKHGKHPVRKLSDQDVKDIRWMVSMGTLTQQAIADMFGVCRIAIYRINKGLTYSHIKA